MTSPTDATGDAAGTATDTGVDARATAKTDAIGDSAERSRLRRLLLARRQALPAVEWARLSAVVSENLQAGFPELATACVAFFWPHRQEADLRPLIRRWWQAAQPGFIAALPVVTAENSALAFRRWTPASTMIADRYGIPTPADGDFVTPAALLIPVNGFDAAGYRLGYGGGYFDRTLASLQPRPLAIGIGFELLRLSAFPHAAHDQPLDAVVTEAGISRPLR
ncbi:MAG TPA: 5-formyltetrahydrofolate cyclo-ligase [Accumulibacter sp.]|nr:5-formyltetrahydrofolate cyclo-ligase [Accumulibacter sp.]HMW17787.1 5-formyltetrahydrofolate cyclo-ligase [Accumulibacter sp.]HMX22290.1 5-formyltetrahydrofolate cyclo-ligase [Accumulibacter sp.]HMY07874.1 5-formyltetrahydrofolate cyclo-ligase [Accumulibacter sp.]HND80936.1 5-formyltetrahydrofolate cyclo-ligase [Accumulibacter sp.]